MSLVYLWKTREKPAIFTKRWIIVWVKRCLQFYPLMRISMKSVYFKIQGAKIGDLSILGKSRLLGPASNLNIGDQVSLGRCEIALHARVSIGHYAVLNDGVVLLTASHSLTDPLWKHKKKPILIGEYAWIATNAIILPGVSIGRGAVVGAGAVVRENVPDYAVVTGNPATVSKVKRTPVLQYSPVLLNAPFEAWVGRNLHNLEGDNL